MLQSKPGGRQRSPWGDRARTSIEAEMLDSFNAKWVYRQRNPGYQSRDAGARLWQTRTLPESSRAPPSNCPREPTPVLQLGEPVPHCRYLA